MRSEATHDTGRCADEGRVMKTTARLKDDVDTVAKDLADMWDNSCECSAKNFNRQAWIKQVILQWLDGVKWPT
jgi:hypothetical protein